MDDEKLINAACTWATFKPDGGLFWETGIYEGENATHYFFLKNEQVCAYLRTSVAKIQFKQQVGC